MSYQVLARKWRPQQFDEVIGQQAVTRTLRNAITSGRIAHGFVFAGPRGCGKTTTARIFARALNCVTGPVAEPCGECDACIEIANGRDIDVLEIDAASHTGIDNIREVVIAGLAIAPVRDRYKVFIIDEVHQLSTASFNALLKSLEEPPPHVIFMMATTELHKIPGTILSRTQVFELKTIPAVAITSHLRRIADTEQLEVSETALNLIAGSAEGSMRDAQSALDQVMAFAGETISVEDVSTVLGLVGRDLLFDLVEAVTDEDAPRAFGLVDRATEAGHELKLVCRELSRLVRDLMILAVDPARAEGGEVAESERHRLQSLLGRFSREDLLRAFEVLARGENEFRNKPSQPRYHFEMLLLRWMHLRKLVPLAELLEQSGGVGRSGNGGRQMPTRRKPVAQAHQKSGRRASPPAATAEMRRVAPATQSGETDTPRTLSIKDKLLAEIQTSKVFFYNTVVAQARKIEVGDDQVVFTFLPAQRALRDQFEETKDWLKDLATRVAGRPIAVSAVQVDQQGAQTAVNSEAVAQEENVPETKDASSGKRDLRAEAMASGTVQAMLDVFPAEIRDVEEV
jgi:DNA polymerase-3 subunit gamma/tau